AARGAPKPLPQSVRPVKPPAAKAGTALPGQKRLLPGQKPLQPGQQPVPGAGLRQGVGAPRVKPQTPTGRPVERRPTAAPGALVPGASAPGAPPPINVVTKSPITRTPLSNWAQVATAGDRQSEADRRADRFEVEVHKKWSISFACISFVIIGIVLALRFPRGGMGLVFGGGLLIFGIHYIGLTAGESLADR